jgi:putative tetratricopeptide repeat-containing domain protein
MKKIFSLAAVAACSMVSMAQNSVISKAAFLQEQNKTAEALEVLKSSFDNPKTTKFAEIYNQAGKLVSTQFNPELMKAAQNEPLDTAKFISSLNEMVDYFTKSYVAEHTPDAKGKMPKVKFSPENTRVLLGCQDYFFYAGIFLNQNHDKAGAYEYFNKHLQFVNNPALADKRDSLIQAKAQNYAQANYYCSMLAYEMKKWDEVLRQTQELLPKKELLAEAKIPVRDLYLMRFEANLTGKKDTLAYVNDLKHAIDNIEDNQAFMESLVAVYNEKNDVKSAEETANEMVAKNPQSKSAWFIKGYVDMNLKHDYAAARNAFDKALELDPNYLEAMANKAYCYINEVVTKRQNGGYKYAGSNLDRVKGQKAVDLYNKELKEIRGYFEKALPLMEKVRELAPERSRLWASALEQIYSNLNQKAKAEEMENIMRQGLH